MWSQRSRVLWLNKGDSNSTFFHGKATYRFRKNIILGIRDKGELWQEQANLIKETIIEFYEELFTTCNPYLQVNSLSYVSQLVPNEINSHLSGDFMEWEVHTALKQMTPLKAPGLDGMPPLFYQHFWEMMNQEVTTTILSWLNTGKLPHLINHTFITLIPKVKSREFVSEYRLISLYNVLYKIFSKVLANRLKIFLPNLITEHQSTFAKNRLISDNILVAFETLHCMKNHN